MVADSSSPKGKDGPPSDETVSGTADVVSEAVAEVVDFPGNSYEPWLFEMMYKELDNRELGVGFIYAILKEFARRHELTDVVVTLIHESFGTQLFRLGGESVSAELVVRLSGEPGVYCEPDKVPAIECDAVRTACQLVMALHHARFSATHDPLTKIANRRSFDEALETAAARSRRGNWTFTLVLVDLNDFKKVNDFSGHDVGDDTLRQFGSALRQAVRQDDTAARIGGDEFAVILSNVDGNDAMGFTERLRARLLAANVLIDFTTGTASSPRDSTNPLELKRIADGRLYEKKGVSR